MGRCTEFGVIINAECDHAMVGKRKRCRCKTCGTICTGRFTGCPAVWAKATGKQRPTTEKANGGVDVVVAPSVAWELTAQVLPPPSKDDEALIDLVRSSWNRPDGVPEPSALPFPIVVRPRLGTRQRYLAAVTAAFVLLGTVAGVAVLTSGDNGAASPAGAAGRAGPTRIVHRFTAEDAGGTTVQRTWALSGRHGTLLRGRVELANPQATPVTAQHQELIPKSLARRTADIVFQPEPVVLEEDPLVQWTVEVPAGGTVTLSYEIHVAPDGLEQHRIDAWVRELQDAIAARQAATTTTTTTTTTTAPPPPPSSPETTAPPRRRSRRSTPTTTQPPPAAPAPPDTTPATAPTTTSPPSSDPPPPPVDPPTTP